MKASRLIGKRLHQERLRCNFSQEALAEMLGTSSRSIIRWEQGQALPQEHFRVQLSRIFGLRPEDLFEDPVKQIMPSPFWTVPYPRNLFFTGREEILQTLHARLGSDRAAALTQSYALHGLGGIGKTQLALEFAYRYAQEYTAVFWIEAETIENIMTSMLRIAEILQLPEIQQDNQQQVVWAVQHWLDCHHQWLLIWDNVEDLDLLQHYLPTNNQGAFLFTTRVQTLRTLVDSLDIPPLSEEEGVKLLLSRTQRPSYFTPQAILRQPTLSVPSAREEATELVHLLEGLPLALDQASAYLEETGCSLADYLRRYREHRPQILARRGIHSGIHPASVTTTLHLAIEQVESHYLTATDLLRVCAFLHPEAIPEELFAEGAPHLGPELGPAVADAYQFELTLAALRGASLITRYPETRMLSVHRLVQAVLQDQMESDEAKLWRKRVVYMVNAAFPDGTFATWVQCQRYLAQALACVPLMQLLDTNFPEAGELLFKVGSYLMERGRYKEAEPLLEQALTWHEAQHDPSPLELIQRLIKRAELFWRQGKYTPVEPLLQRILVIEEQVLGPDHPDIAETLNNLALLYWEQGKYELAEPLYQQALRIREEQSGPEGLQTANTLGNLGLLYWRQGQYELAEPFSQRALSIYEKLLGNDHPETAKSLNNLAHLYRDQEKYELAEALYQRALQTKEQQLGADHPDTILVLNNLANLYQDQGKDELAEPLYQRALHAREKGLGPDHPHLAHTLLGLGNLYRHRRDYEQAEPLYQRALRIQEARLGSDHLNVALTLYGLAALYEDQGKDELAEHFLQRSLMIRKCRLAPNHPAITETQAALEKLYKKQRKRVQAHPLQVSGGNATDR